MKEIKTTVFYYLNNLLKYFKILETRSKASLIPLYYVFNAFKKTLMKRERSCRLCCSIMKYLVKRKKRSTLVKTMLLKTMLICAP